MGEWECTVCGHLHEGEEPPAVCPECGATKDKFEYYSYEDDDEFDEELDDEGDALDEDWSELNSTTARMDGH
ncbi:MAG: hypothetical protein LC737_05055 [Chloroflexi bacterium]|nr:hypothetical protein [Chloroflexota bacterium]